MVLTAGIDDPCTGMAHPCAGIIHPSAGISHPRMEKEHSHPGMGHPCAGIIRPCAGISHPRTGIDHPSAGFGRPYREAGHFHAPTTRPTPRQTDPCNGQNRTIPPMRIAHYDEGLTWDNPNLRWGDPSYLLEPGDPGYVPPFSSPKKPKKHMKRKPYLPDDEPGILSVLTALDTNLPGALATKYEVTAAQLLRLRNGRYAYEWFMSANSIARQWSKSMSDAHDSMTTANPAPLTALPGGPTLPAAPTFNTPPVTAQYEPGFFDFLGRLVQGIKTHDNWDETDGLLLKILGAEIGPPDEAIVPEVKFKYAPSGRPILVVKKMDFQGYTIFVARGAGPMTEIGFSTTREYEIVLPLPAQGQFETWQVQVQYRYQNEPFGQKSQVIDIPVKWV